MSDKPLPPDEIDRILNLYESGNGSHAPVPSSLRRHISALTQQVRELREALVSRGRHKNDCMRNATKAGQEWCKCTCGLDDVLAKYPKEPR